MLLMTEVKADGTCNCKCAGMSFGLDEFGVIGVVRFYHIAVLTMSEYPFPFTVMEVFGGLGEEDAC